MQATICPVNKPHPRLDMIVSGSSRSLYAWRPTAQGVPRAWYSTCHSLLQVYDMRKLTLALDVFAVFLAAAHAELLPWP